MIPGQISSSTTGSCFGDGEDDEIEGDGGGWRLSNCAEGDKGDGDRKETGG